MKTEDKETIREILGWHGADISEDVAEDIIAFVEGKGWHKNEYHEEL